MQLVAVSLHFYSICAAVISSIALNFIQETLFFHYRYDLFAAEKTH